jgi:hypothetical protein
MASFYDQIPGYREAVARETIGRDAAYLDLPKLIVTHPPDKGVVVRPFTLRDYLRLSAANNAFIAGGRAGKDGACFLLWHQRINPVEDDDLEAFIQSLDTADITVLRSACAIFVNEAMADAPQGGASGKGSYYGVGAMLIGAFRHAYPGIGKPEILDTPLDQLWQEYRYLQHERNPQSLMFNRSDHLKSKWLRQMMDERTAKAKPKPKRRSKQ